MKSSIKNAAKIPRVSGLNSNVSCPDSLQLSQHPSTGKSDNFIKARRESKINGAISNELRPSQLDILAGTMEENLSSKLGFKDVGVNTNKDYFSMQESLALIQKLLKEFKNLGSSNRARISISRHSVTRNAMTNSGTQTDKSLINNLPYARKPPKIEPKLEYQSVGGSVNPNTSKITYYKRNFEKSRKTLLRSFHTGKWVYHSDQNRYAWSCCMNYFQESKGCQQYLVKKHSWCLLSD